MKRLILCLGVVLVAGNAWAADAEPLRMYGNMACSQDVPCSTYSGIAAFDPKLKELINKANSCIGRRQSPPDSEGFFIEAMGMDSNNCLTTRELPKAAVGATITPICCMTPTQNDMCRLQCKFMGLHP